MARYTARERRERYLREYDFQKKSGKPFFPGAILHDTIASLFFLGLIIGITIWWHADFHGIPEGATEERGGGILGPAYEGQADPGVEEYDPRPEWYFFFLFQLLRIFKAPELLLFATIIIPTAWMILLIAWPFLDRRPERRVSRRPIAMAIGASVPIVLLTLTWYGSKAPSVGAASNHPGAFAFARTNACGTCHTIADAGTGGNVGPNLDAAQPTFESAHDIITNGRGGMPAFGDNLSEDALNCMAGYVATWAGAEGETPGPNADGAAQVYPSSCEAAGPDYAGSAEGG